MPHEALASDLLRRAWPFPERADAIAAEIVERMRDRPYHGVGHVQRMLNRLTEMSPGSDPPPATVAFIFFHDAIYDATRTDNEAQSAELFLTTLDATRVPCTACGGAGCEPCHATGHRYEAPAGIDPGYLERVTETILATREHFGDHPAVVDSSCLDLDLSFFGEPWDLFRADSEAIREEWCHIDDETFYAGRVHFLESVLARDRIYRTGTYRARFEAQARENLARAVAKATG